MSLKYLDENGLIYYHSLIKEKLNSKVDKAFKTGSETIYKVLSDNNFTDGLLAKLNKIADGAQVNVLEGIQKNGVDIEIKNKKANIIIPTSLSGFTNDGFVSYLAQDLTSTQQAQVRKNIGAGTSNFSGNYDDLTNLPTIPTKLSELTNDGNFVTDANYVHTDKNFTNTLLTKLNGIAEQAQVNVIETIKVNNVVQAITSKAVNISVPTKVGQLTNDSKYQTESQVSASIKSALSGITGISFYKCKEGEYNAETGVPTLTTGKVGVIYLTPVTSTKINNSYTEWYWDVDSKTYEKMGTTEVDLSNYVSFDDLIAITNGEIDAIVAA